MNKSILSNIPLLEVKEITKEYPGVRALDKVNFNVIKGEVHCLVGENGAGKSTLIEILAGALEKDSGQIFINGNEIKFNSPRDSQKMGIAVLHQELPVHAYLNVAENIFLGRQPRNKFGLIDFNEMNKQAKYWLNMIKADVDPKALLGSLPVAKQQLVSVAKALSLEAKIIFLDEPSAVLTIVELKSLFKLLNSLKKEGRGIVYISHRLEEIFEIGDRVTVLRNGKKVATNSIDEITEKLLIKMMVGKEIINDSDSIKQKEKTTRFEEKILSVKEIYRKGILEDICLDVRKGEILGIYGLVGSGRTELARAIIGADKIDRGEVYINNNKVKISSPKDAIKLGICLVPEDRKLFGLFLEKSIQENISLPNLKRLKKFYILDYVKIKNYVKNYIKALNIKVLNLDQRVKFLSGGNQQKVVLAKWFGVNSKVLIFDEPTRGVDVGAKEEIRNLIKKIASKGKGIIVISSELPEIMNLSDRIIVMHSGKITAELLREKATKEKLLTYSMGVTK